MNKIPGLKADVGFGSADAKLPNWRNSVADDELDPDDEQIETPEDVKAMLGFDPASEDDEANLAKLARDVIVNKLAARNSTMLEQVSPSPMIGRYAEGKRQKAKNSGTSEGAKKGWLQRMGAMSDHEAAIHERQMILAGRILKRLNKSKRPKPLPVAKTRVPVSYLRNTTAMNSHDAQLAVGHPAFLRFRTFPGVDAF